MFIILFTISVFFHFFFLLFQGVAELYMELKKKGKAKIKLDFPAAPVLQVECRQYYKEKIVFFEKV